MAYGKKDCGINFIESLNNGTVSIHLLDQDTAYQKIATYKGQTGKHENFVYQYTHTPCDEKCLGTNKKDMADIIITGLDKVA